MLKELRKERAHLLALSFWATIILVRGFLFFQTIVRGGNPRIELDYIPLHHYIVGIFFLFLVAVTFALRVKPAFLRFVGLGIGIALVTDEFSFLWQLSSVAYWNRTISDYWSLTNFLAISVVGILFLVIAFLPKKKIKKEGSPAKI